MSGSRSKDPTRRLSRPISQDTETARPKRRKLREPASLFEGFTSEAIAFLAGLAANNEVGWFESHRPEYERFLVAPMRALVGEFGEWLEAEVDAGMETRPQIGRAIGRMRRDTRFARDKRPYKETVWIVFRNPRAVPTMLGFYWELSPTRYVYGMGFYSAPPAVMRAVREQALAAPERFYAAVAPIEARPEFEVSGEPYRRTSMPGAPERLRFWLDRKNLYVNVSRSHDDALFSRALVSVLWDAWERLIPLYRFLKECAGRARAPALS